MNHLGVHEAGHAVVAAGRGGFSRLLLSQLTAAFRFWGHPATGGNCSGRLGLHDAGHAVVVAGRDDFRLPSFHKAKSALCSSLPAPVEA